MILARLKDNLCPGCRSPLKFDILDDMHRCTKERKEDCQFEMTDEAFTKEIERLYAPRHSHYPSEEDNLSALNNFGHKVRSEDYSDQL
jgi:hypothetical protein